ncbi:MAG: hypothetical protein BAJALOKI2v1_270004 [Promethearchaeota archaeon]|nr:MAG: hypothetical protein BAJALOKI2v1_270004 [Candidatus Lokiarchaeota archaeon]
MGKEKKPEKSSNLGIKTSRYFTRKCPNCGAEFAYWFTICPKCKKAWDDMKQEDSPKRIKRKNVKIVVKITEEDFEEPIDKISLVFSADRGRTWYRQGMENQVEYYISEIPDVPVKAVIIYYIEVLLENGNQIIENNEGKYFYYKVGKLEEESISEPSKKEAQQIEKNISESLQDKKDYYTPKDVSKTTDQSMQVQEPIILEKNEKTANVEPLEPTQEVSEYEDIEDSSEEEKELTIFGKPQTEVDPELKVCPHCNSKIKKMWSTCPICGKHL